MAAPSAQALYEDAKTKLGVAITAGNENEAVKWAQVVYWLADVRIPGEPV